MGFGKTLTEAIRAPFAKRSGLGSITGKDYAKDNGFFDYCRNAADTALLPLFGSDSADQIHLAGQRFAGSRMVKTFYLATNASITSQAFWIADAGYTITNISCMYQTADGATNTAYVAKAVGTAAPTAAGAVSLMSGTFNMNTTTKTPQIATLASAWNIPAQTGIQLAAGDRLVFILASAVTSLAGVVVTVTMVPGNKTQTAEYAMQLNGDIATTSFFLSLGSYVITGAKLVYSVKGTDGSAVTADITKDTGTTAPGAGTSILSATISLKGTINTVNSGSLAALATTLRMNQGDRLAFKLTGTPTALAGLVIVVYMEPIQGWIDIPFVIPKAANAVDQTFFIADRDYEFLAAGASYGTAEGSALTLAITRESSTTAAGGGTSMQSGTFNLNTTTNTPLFATLLGIQNNILKRGDRLSLHFSTTVTTAANGVGAVKLRPC